METLTVINPPFSVRVYSIKQTFFLRITHQPRVCLISLNNKNELGKILIKFFVLHVYDSLFYSIAMVKYNIYIERILGTIRTVQYILNVNVITSTETTLYLNITYKI